MLTIAIVSGAGTAAAARIAQRVREHLEAENRRARVVQALVMDLLSPAFRADLVVTTVAVPLLPGVPQVSGMPLLLGTAETATFTEIDRLLDELASSTTDELASSSADELAAAATEHLAPASEQE